MFSKIGSWFKSFFGNIAADPVSSLKGIVSLAAAGATCYGMATGTVPINQLSIGAASALTTHGLHALGTDATTGKTDAVIDAAIQAAQMAASAAPTVMTITDHYNAIKDQTGQAQAILAAATEAAAALSAATSAPVAQEPAAA